MLKIDFTNAFNTIRRDQVLKQTRSALPKLYPMVYQSYSEPTNLFFGPNIIDSAEGVQQGDPLGPALFCLRILGLSQCLTSRLNIWYMDDGTTGDTPEAVLADLQSILAAQESTGLSVNDSKCELVVLSADPAYVQGCIERFQAVPPNVRIVNASSVSLLGSPLMEGSLESVLSSKLEDLKRMADRLVDVDPHDALFMLQHCFSIPKMMYVLRTAPAFSCPHLCDYDDVLRACLEQTLNIKMGGAAWNQASLPVSQGGLGVRSAVDLSLPSFLASAHASSSVVSDILPVDISNEPYRLQQDAESAWLAVADQIYNYTVET